MHARDNRELEKLKLSLFQFIKGRISYRIDLIKIVWREYGTTELVLRCHFKSSKKLVTPGMFRFLRLEENFQRLAMITCNH